MKTTIKTTLQTLALGLALAAFALPPAQAGSPTASHTYVSSTGNDANSKSGIPCGRTAPCATFQGALSVTNPGGLISVIDSGDYGHASISQNVTIDGTGSNAAITVATGNAVDINMGFNAVVTLRHLTLTGPRAANTTGVLQGGGSLLVDGCKISGFSAGLDGSGNIVVQNTTITNCGDGIVGKPTLLSLRDSTIQGCTFGVSLIRGGLVDVSRCTIAQNSNGGLGGFGTAGTTTILTATGCTISGNGTGVQAGANITINLNDNDVWNNTTGFSTNNNGIIATAGNNRKAGNTTPGAPTPGATVLIQ